MAPKIMTGRIGLFLALLCTTQVARGFTNVDLGKAEEAAKSNRQVYIVAGATAAAGAVLTLIGFATAEEKSPITEANGTTYVDVSGEQKYEPNATMILGMGLLMTSLLILTFGTH